MCYCGCVYENYHGDCKKPRHLPCPDNEEAVAAYEDAMDRKYDEMADERLLAQEEEE